MKLLRQHGAYLNVKSPKAHSLAHIAVEKRCLDILVYLSGKIDTDELDYRQRTPLISAVLFK